MTVYSPKSLAGIAIFVYSITAAHALECVDPALTKAISEAMARAPQAGECNANLYANASTHEQRVTAVKKVLVTIHISGANNIPTQRLPLRSNEKIGDQN